MNAAQASTSPGLHDCIVRPFGNVSTPLGRHDSTGELLNGDAFMHHDNQEHSALKHCALPSVQVILLQRFTVLRSFVLRVQLTPLVDSKRRP